MWQLVQLPWLFKVWTQKRDGDKYFFVFEFEFPPTVSHRVCQSEYSWGHFWILESPLIRSSLNCIRHDHAYHRVLETLDLTTSTKLRSHIELALSLHWMYPSVGVRRDLYDQSQRLLMLNLNFWIALLQLFAFFIVLRVLGIVFALRTSPLDNEEDDDEKNDNCKEDPDDDRHQKSIGILLGRVDCVLEKRNRFLSRCIFKNLPQYVLLNVFWLW